MKQFLLLLSAFFLISHSLLAAPKKQRKQRAKTSKGTPVKLTPSPVLTPNTASTLMLCNATNGMPTWYICFVKGFAFPAQHVSPSQYRLLKINQAQLQSFLHSIPDTGGTQQFNFPVYKNGTLHCHDVRIERVQTMDAELQAKYPELMTFKIYDPNNLLNAGRIECDGTITKMTYTVDGETFYATPYTFQGVTYYACYSKNDPNFKKQAFEK